METRFDYIAVLPCLFIILCHLPTGVYAEFYSDPYYKYCVFLFVQLSATRQLKSSQLLHSRTKNHI